ncbi:hypothetical protein [Streptomyces sp. NPDC006463]|uniref:hypothetical protein n=1 Tax=Streptomyces sp. NPDC006463 TaxID=3364746 RepID=UPI0036C06C41
MRVRCTKIVHPQADLPVAEYDGIRVGGIYTVLEIEVLADSEVQIRVLGEDSEEPGLFWDVADFDVLDAGMPACWALVLDNRGLSLAPALWQRPGFWTDYYRRDPRALADFETVKRELLDDSAL